MMGFGNKTKSSVSKDPTTVAGTGGFAATLKILEEAESSPRRCLEARLRPIPDFKYTEIKKNGTTSLSPDSNTSSRKIPWQEISDIKSSPRWVIKLLNIYHL